MGRENELVAIRVLREQDWAYNAWRSRLSYSEIARRSSLSPGDGGLGYGLSEQQIKQRLDGYRDRMLPFLEANAVTARERQIAELDELSRLAHAALLKAAAGGNLDKDAAKLLLDIHAREAKLLGLDAPTTVVADVRTSAAIDEELNAMLARIPSDRRWADGERDPAPQN